MTDGPLAATRALLERAGVPIPDTATPADVAMQLGRAMAECSDRPLLKTLRREAYRLRQRGIDVPDVRAAPTVRPVLGPAIEGFVSAVDGRGDRLVWLVRERADGRHLLVAADVNEPDGLRDLRVLDVTRKQLRTMRDRFATEGSLRIVAADWRAVDALVVEAQDRLPHPVDRRLDYRRVRAELVTEPPDAPGELVSARASTGEPVDARTAVTESELLLSEPELRSWWPSPDRVALFVEAIHALRAGPIVLTPAQSEARLAVILDGAVIALFPPAVTARRLQATAYVLAETGRLDAARRALAIAEALHRMPEAAGEVPLLRSITHRTIGAHLAAGQAAVHDERRDALILTPAEVAARATGGSPFHRPRSRG